MEIASPAYPRRPSGPYPGFTTAAITIAIISTVGTSLITRKYPDPTAVFRPRNLPDVPGEQQMNADQATHQQQFEPKPHRHRAGDKSALEGEPQAEPDRSRHRRRHDRRAAAAPSP